MRERASPRLASWFHGALKPAATLAVVIALAACSSAPPRVYAPLRYDYLLPLRLNVASVTVEQRFIAGGANDLSGQDPVPPVTALTAMAQDRLQAVGTSGRAVFVIKDASLLRTPDGGISGSMDVELDVYAGGGTRAGFAEARVARTQSGHIDDLRAALYDMTKQMMDAMNVEFEYQVRRSLRDWLVSATPAPVEQQALPPPPGAAPASQPLAPPPAIAPPQSYAPPQPYAPPQTLAPAQPFPPQPRTMSPPPQYLTLPPSAPTPYAAPNPYTTPTPYPSPTPYPTPYAAPTPYPNVSPYPAPSPYPGQAPTPLSPPGQP
jgi:hypothetical protein